MRRYALTLNKAANEFAAYEPKHVKTCCGAGPNPAPRMNSGPINQNTLKRVAALVPTRFNGFIIFAVEFIRRRPRMNSGPMNKNTLKRVAAPDPTRFNGFTIFAVEFIRRRGPE